MTFIFSAFFLCLAAYLIGSIPFGLLLTKCSGAGDIREIGSGNIGATNVLRTGKKAMALLTFLFDAFKGTFAVFIARYFHESLEPLAAFAALCGHIFPVWLKFKGGKGVATAIGIYLAIYWPIAPAVLLIWIVMAIVTRYSSLASLISTTLAPLMAFVLGHVSAAYTFLAISVLIILRHKDNIKRLWAGNESKIGEK